MGKIDLIVAFSSLIFALLSRFTDLSGIVLPRQYTGNTFHSTCAMLSLINSAPHFGMSVLQQESSNCSSGVCLAENRPLVNNRANY